MSLNDANSGVSIGPDDPLGETAQKLIEAMCVELSERYGAPPSPFSSAEAGAGLGVFLVALMDQQPIGCGALRRIDDKIVEVKRMYVAPSARRKGVARSILNELERRAAGFGYTAIRLETGVRQPEAQRLYESLGFQRIPPFGKYVSDPMSVCYEKLLTEKSHEPQSFKRPA